MSRLDRFLNAVDLDELLAARQSLSKLSWAEKPRLEWIIRRWNNRQAVANLLFHPDVIPAGIRVKAVSRGLRSYDDPYLSLAAVVGLPSIKADRIADLDRWFLTWSVWAMIQSIVPVLAARASVSAFSWLSPAEVPTILCLYRSPTRRRRKTSWPSLLYGSENSLAMRSSATSPIATSPPQRRLHLKMSTMNTSGRNLSAKLPNG